MIIGLIYQREEETGMDYGVGNVAAATRTYDS